MAEYFLTRQAEEDIDGIGLYTLANWGLSAAEDYLSDFDACFVRLAADTGLGKDKSDIRSGLLACSCNHHVIFFRRDAQGTAEVLRVLHERMDFERHL